MAGKQVQRRRGSTSQTAVFTGALGEVTVDTTKFVEVVHDGITPGGFPQASARDIAASTTATDNKLALKVSQDSATGAAKVPKGSTAQRPAAPQPGDFRFNTETAKFEGYVNATLLWQPVGSDSIPLFSVFWFPKRTAIPAGFVAADGQLLSRATYPDAIAGIQAGNVPGALDADWLAQPTVHGFYTGGDGATNFRIPDYNGKAAGSLGATFLRGDGALSNPTNGYIQVDAFMDHQHFMEQSTTVLLQTGVTIGGAGSASYTVVGVGAGAGSKTSQPSNARWTTETRPLNVSGCWCIKLFGAVVNPGSADAAQLATDMANMQANLQAQQNQFGYGPGGAVSQGVPYSFRNRLINGAFNTNQRYGAIAVSFAASEVKYFTDRWQMGTVSTTGVSTQYADLSPGDAPMAAEGIPCCELFNGSISGANGLMYLTQHIEGVTSVGSGPIMVSFWARRTVAGPIGVRVVQNFGGGGSTNLGLGFVKINATTTWQKFKVPVTLPSLAGKTIGTNNSLMCTFDLAVMGNQMPSGYGADPGWNPGGQALLAGVQLERGTIATPFELLPYALNVALCERYLEIGDGYMRGYGNNSAGVGLTIGFHTRKRTSPQMSLLSQAVTNSSIPNFPQVSPSSVCASIIPVSATPGGYIADFTWLAEADY